MTVASLTTSQSAGDRAEAARTRRAGKTRVQFDLSPSALALLNELKDRTEAASYAEVFKNALKLYDGLITEAERGSEFLVRDREGKVSALKIFL